ncbi:MAG: HlyD family efflux transporter periplasmic adaptor subunit [Oscillospiraceae bacterium]|nr:HlyD family efflux transporter periplasmic adaptor subunit [Oscillospiraceae bacterium]
MSGKLGIINLSELTDSKEVLVERPHKFVSIFVYILISLLAIALIWSIFGEIDVYIRASGTVRPNDTVSTVRSTSSGTVTDVNIRDGMMVQSGDILFSVDNEEHLNTLGVLERQYATILLEIENLQIFRESIILGENLFNRNDEAQFDYYFRFLGYLADIETSVEQLTNTNLDILRFRVDAESTRENTSIAIAHINSERSDLQSLYNSINQGQNLIPTRNGQQNRWFLDYNLNFQRFTEAIQMNRDNVERFERLYEVGGVSRNERDAARFELNFLQLERDSFVNEAQLSVLQGITSFDLNLLELNAALRSTEAMLELPEGGFSEELLRERLMLDTLNFISDALFNLQNNLYSLQNDKGSLQIHIDNSQVSAPIDGVVSMFAELSVGDFVQTGMNIATILPASEGEHRVMLLVSNADVADIEVGQPIYFRFAALPFADFGEMPGSVTRISTDAHSTEDGQSFFLVEAEMESGSLFDRDGTESEILVGMVCDARVITRTQRIIFWVLERLNFWD